jgi:uncharacterized membrane protein YedE/YeeE
MVGVVSLACGLVFGAGLAISGMTNPAKVIGFLDLFGDWDPTLTLVMAGAVAVSTVGFAWARRLERPWFGEHFAFPTRRDIDANLVGGSVLFGLGWGLTGLCPGPAIANLSRGSFEIVLFVAAMAAGALLHNIGPRRRTLGRSVGGLGPSAAS